MTAGQYQSKVVKWIIILVLSPQKTGVSNLVFNYIQRSATLPSVGFRQLHKWPVALCPVKLSGLSHFMIKHTPNTIEISVHSYNKI